MVQRREMNEILVIWFLELVCPIKIFTEKIFISLERHAVPRRQSSWLIKLNEEIILKIQLLRPSTSVERITTRGEVGENKTSPILTLDALCKNRKFVQSFLHENYKTNTKKI